MVFKVTSLFYPLVLKDPCEYYLFICIYLNFSFKILFIFFQFQKDEVNRTSKGRTGWPEHVWALEFKQEQNL